MKVILLGPSGAGKGTQAALIAESLGVPQLSSGELFRDHQQRDTELGRLARTYMKRGALVPDSLTIKMVMGWVESNREANGFLLDGFPRTLPQAQALDAALAQGGGSIDVALYIKVPTEVLIRRITGRLLCRGCTNTFHQEFAAPSQPGVCDRCGGELYRREDDNPEAAQKKIKVYLDETQPLIEYYRAAGKLAEVDGDQSVKDVSGAIKAALGLGQH